MTSIQTQTSLALGRSTSYDQVLDLAPAGDPTAGRKAGTAARAFGVLIANIALPERILLTGEGIRLAKVGWDRLQDSIGENRNPEASKLDVRLIDDDPSCGRGALPRSRSSAPYSVNSRDMPESISVHGLSTPLNQRSDPAQLSCWRAPVSKLRS